MNNNPPTACMYCRADIIHYPRSQALRVCHLQYKICAEFHTASDEHTRPGNEANNTPCVSLLVMPAYFCILTASYQSTLMAECVFYSVAFSWVCMSTTCLGYCGSATMFLLLESALWLGASHHGIGLTRNQGYGRTKCCEYVEDLHAHSQISIKLLPLFL